MALAQVWSFSCTSPLNPNYHILTRERWHLPMQWVALQERNLNLNSNVYNGPLPQSNILYLLYWTANKSFFPRKDNISVFKGCLPWKYSWKYHPEQKLSVPPFTRCAETQKDPWKMVSQHITGAHFQFWINWCSENLSIIISEYYLTLIIGIVLNDQYEYNSLHISC